MDAVSDLIGDGDLLGGLGLKPWWESWREYAYKGCIAVIVVFAVSDSSRLNCLPSATDPSVYTDPQIVASNIYCNILYIPWYIAYGGLVAFGISMVTFVLSNYWVHISGVSHRLADVSKFGRNLLDLNMNAEEMMNASVSPITSSSNEKIHRLRKSVEMLLKYRSHSALSQVYYTRCMLVLLWTGLCSTLVFWVTIKDDIASPQTSTCVISDPNIMNGLGNSSRSFICVKKPNQAITMIEVIFAFALLFQFLAMAAALWSQYRKPRKELRTYERCPQAEYDDQQTVTSVRDLETFLIQMMRLNTKQAATIQAFTKFVVFGGEFTRKLKVHCDKAIISDDVEYFRILKRKIPSEEFWKIIEEKSTVVLQEGERRAGLMMREVSQADSDYKVYTFLENIALDHDMSHQAQRNTIRDVHLMIPLHPVTNSQTEKYIFGRSLMARASWHLLFCCPVAFEHPDFLAKVNFDILDEEGRSCLFYILRRSSMDNLLSRFLIFNNIVRSFGKNQKVFVHFDGKSMKPEDFFYQNYPGYYRGELPDFRLCDVENVSNPVDACEADLEKLLDDYLNNDENIPGKLSRLKTTRLNGRTAADFARQSLDNKHWEVLVALINTYIVIYEQGKRPDHHGLIGNDIFHLSRSEHIEDILREALKRPRYKPYFVPTAAEHIMSIVSSDVSKGMLESIKVATIPDEVKIRLQKLSKENC